VKRTSGIHSLSMTKDEMGDYMDKCAALTGVPLPTIEELEELGYLKKSSGKKVDYPSEEGNIPTQF
jgi:tRNA A37 threonylcarbamoyltransferase TsaD